MQLTLYKTLCIHTLMVMGIGGYFVEQRRAHAVMPPVRHVRMPTVNELWQIEYWGDELWAQSASAVGGLYLEPANLHRQYRELIDLQSLYMPPEHPEVVKNRQRLAQSLERACRDAEAAEQYHVLLKIFQRVMGADDPMTVECQQKLSRVLEKIEHNHDEEMKARDFWKAQSRALGESHPKVLQAQADVARRLMQQSKFDEAERMLRTVIERQATARGGADFSIGFNLTSLATCLQVQGKHTAALETLQEIEWLIAESPKDSVWVPRKPSQMREEILSHKLRPRPRSLNLR